MLNAAPPRNGIVRLSQRELDKLLEKARGHDQYVEACRIMREKQDAILAVDVPNAYARGWLAAMREFSEAVVTAGLRRDEPC